MRSRLSPERIAYARSAIGGVLVDGFFRHTSRLASLHPKARPEAHGVVVERDVVYARSGASGDAPARSGASGDAPARSGASDHLLDVWRPREAKGPLPIVLYVHGGGFRILSKDTHWVMALSFARQGFLVFNIDYRLAPKHRYPAALEDCAEAYAWVVENAARHGGDLSRLVLAGESAGANLVTSMAIAASFDRSEPYAKRIFETGVVPRAVLPACGIFQVSDVERFGRRRRLPTWLMDRLVEVSRSYLPHGVENAELADPLVVLERGDPPARPLPPFFLPCGTKDPLLDDTRRLGRALEALGAKAEVAIYPGEPHAFHAFVFREQARRCWRDSFRFLDEALA